MVQIFPFQKNTLISSPQWSCHIVYTVYINCIFIFISPTIIKYMLYIVLMFATWTLRESALSFPRTFEIISWFYSAYIYFPKSKVLAYTTEQRDTNIHTNVGRTLRGFYQPPFREGCYTALCFFLLLGKCSFYFTAPLVLVPNSQLCKQSTSPQPPLLKDAQILRLHRLKSSLKKTKTQSSQMTHPVVL